MTPERWEQIDRVWQAVLARPFGERAAAVIELSAGDEALRHEVESLLAHRAQASAAGFGDTPLEVTPPRASLLDRQLGPYTVQALLGVGGMGEVYRAHDATLGRDVAVKILPEPWLTDPGRRARFEREARLLASLNHPNIGAIYGVHESDGVRALILELVEGETLAERIAREVGTPGGRRGLPLSDVVAIARQLTAALQAAHGRGIVHRDLKPANIKITPDTQVKVLDFGLARAVSGADNRPDIPSGHAATMSATHVGVLLGTAAYMSPEQARGRTVDKRADIWAFGCVLYEMLTGVHAFGGADVAEVLANVIKAEPDWSALPADTPSAVWKCLRGCLQKDAEQRIHDIADVRLALEGAFEEPAGDLHGIRGIRSSRWRVAYTGWAVAALVAAAAAAVMVPSLRRAAADAPEAVLQKTATPPVLFSPRAGGGGTATATTIQEAIDQVGRGGTVTVLPGTYGEALTITKGLTLQATGERSGAVILAPSGSRESVVEIATTEPVTLRGLTIHVQGANGIRGVGAVDLTVERSTVLAVNPPEGRSQLIQVANNATPTGPRARAIIRQSVLDGAVAKLPPRVARPLNHAVLLAGDIDGLLERNTVRRTGGICVVVSTRDDFGGHLNVDLVDNDIDECHPVARVSAIKVGIPSVLTLSPGQPITATGTVNIIGNTIRNSSEDCLASAIAFDTFGGRIERNRIVSFVQQCAMPTSRNLPGAIWLGLWGDVPRPVVTPTVRFNDIVGNAHAGLRLAPNYTIRVDASCNYWGSELGPSGAGPGAGDVLLVGQGATTPVFLPFATAPIARTKNSGC